MPSSRFNAQSKPEPEPGSSASPNASDDAFQSVQFRQYRLNPPLCWPWIDPIPPMEVTKIIVSDQPSLNTGRPRRSAG